MKKILLVICYGLILASCNKDPELTFEPELYGTYTGTFSSVESFKISNVSIEIMRSSVTGESDEPYFPAICHANYKIDGSII
jgi:hypothetical protein